MNRTIVFTGLLAAMLFVPSQAQKKASDLSANAMMVNIEKGFEGIRDFVVTIEAEVDMERLRVPKMKATMYFKKPDKVHFSSSNFAMLPREGIVLNPTLLRERYEPKVEGEEVVDNMRLLKLHLIAKEAKVRPNKLLLWVDPLSWTIARMESVPYQGRVLRLAFTHILQPGGFWLPQAMKATFEVATRDTSARRLDLDVQAPPQMEELQRPPRGGSITVRYIDYRVNVGLADDLFEKREGSPKVR